MKTDKSVRFGLLFTLVLLLFFVSSSLAAFDYTATRHEIFNRELAKIDFVEVKKDIIHLLHSSEPFHPSDYHHYGPFLIRMAWHCAGTYRQSDGEGGCDGARQRFAPEADWEDNANLLQARKLLWPIKKKYGFGLSWGDLITLTGTVAIEDMKGPSFGWCGGRIDDTDKRYTEVLGPSWVQEHMENCQERGENGDCKDPLGQNTIGLIYVNPEGFMGKPDPEKSAQPTREVFARMGMNDTETMALIAGGHSFGKTHGDPKGVDTSHIEGPWTATPLEFNTDFIKLLFENDWEKYKGPGGRYQFRPKYKLFKKLFYSSSDNKANETDTISSTGVDTEKRASLTAPSADLKGTQSVMMMTTDVALKTDKNYTEILHKFLNDTEYFKHMFGYSWYKLMTRDAGPVSRCVGPFTPKAQDFQGPLPESYKTQPSLSDVEVEIINLFDKDNFDPALFVELAYLCSATFRTTDYNGGCNGARIRLSPEKNWPERKGMAEVMAKLEPIKQKFTKSETNGISLSDLIVFSGTAAFNNKHSILSWKTKLEFCPGRVDAETAPNSEKLRLWKYSDKGFEFRRQARLFDISQEQLVALMGRPRSAEYMKLLGYSGTYSETSSLFTNEYFKLLISQNWTKTSNCEKTNCSELVFGAEYTNDDKTRFITERDMLLREDDELLGAVFEFAGSQELFETVFIATWSKLMNADRFDGPVENLCSNGKITLYELKQQSHQKFIEVNNAQNIKTEAGKNEENQEKKESFVKRIKQMFTKEKAEL